MTWRRWLRLCLALCGLATLAVGTPAYAQERSAADAHRQILVMLKMAPPHYRPGAAYSGSYGDGAAMAARRRLAAGIARRNRLKLVDGWPMPLIGVDCYVMRVPDGMAMDAAIAQVSKDSAVAWSQPLQTYQARGSPVGAAPNDPLFRAQPAAMAWRLADLHRIATGRNVSIAIIDSKIDVAHPDLAGQFTANLDFVANSDLDRRSASGEAHGTGVAGIVGAKAGNGIGIAGIAPDARMMALRACWQTAAGPTLCNSLSLARALQFAIEHKAEVINLSLAGPADPLLARLIDLAVARNLSVVAAFDPSLPQGGFPASMPGVVAVADESLRSLPARVYIAPGRDVPTTQPGGKWYLVNGSSYAVAHVTGLIALMRQAGGRATHITLDRMASGAIDACASLVGTSPGCDCSCAIDRRLATRPR
ncbi:S8 family peptidase [Sphingomonas pruni]|uniref:S8 family peptidase n=1 Tax=Sphingomonas pruni TaxID=40683 RepID=UPI000830A745|nr:S8 family serine peptidase [Sphingomonas pruni]